MYSDLGIACCVVRNGTFLKKAPVASAVFAIFCVLSLSSESSAQEVEKRSQIGPWSVYCLTRTPNPKVQDCSVVGSFVADAGPDAWLKLAFAFDPSPFGVTMTIKTPHLDYFSRGISLSADNKQLGRAYIEKCTESFCQTTVHADARLLNGLATSKTATFEYQTNEEEGVSLAVELKELVPAIGQLAGVLGLSDQQWKPEDQTVFVEMRTVPFMSV
jgi:invasion protein IalB